MKCWLSERARCGFDARGWVVAQDHDRGAAAIEVGNWRRALPRHVRVLDTPGDHYSVLQGTNLDALADQLGRELKRTSE